jgi:hypothetical protein
MTGWCFRCQVVGYRGAEFVRRRGWTRLWHWLNDCPCPRETYEEA